jgi:hypothetical protein
MADQFMCMVCIREDPSGMSGWTAIAVEGHGRVLTRVQAEAVAAQLTHPRRFLFAFTEQSEQFADDSGQVLAFLPGETIWHYGEPFRVDIVDMFRGLMDGAESPERFTVAVPVADAVAAAQSRFRDADAHLIETMLDECVMELGGKARPGAACLRA